MFDGIEFRGFAQATVEGLPPTPGCPVWNGLTDRWHPTQMLADVRTMLDHTDRPIEEVSCCYVGDGRNNTANSLLVTGALLGMDIRVATPDELRPSDAVASHRRRPGRGLGRPAHRLGRPHVHRGRSRLRLYRRLAVHG